MSRNIRIDGPAIGRASLCEPILRALPLWFGIESSIVQYVKDIEVMPTFLAVADDVVLGFLTVNRHNDYAAEIHVIAVLSELHDSGVGSKLLREAETWLLSLGVEYLQVKTLGPSKPNKEYARTREFYFAKGFRPLEELKELWGGSNPCLILVKRLGQA